LFALPPLRAVMSGPASAWYLLAYDVWVLSGAAQSGGGAEVCAHGQEGSTPD